MKHLVIGFDIDGVIADIGSAMLPILSEACNRSVSYHDLCSWDLRKALNIDEKTMASIWGKILETDLLRYAPPIKGAIESISALGKHEIWLVTSRPTSLQDLTLSWLHENRINYNHIVFDRRGDKVSVGPNFDLFVEDFVEEASVIAEAGIITLLFDQPWNNNASILPENCKRVYDWNAILLQVNELEES